MHIKAGKRTISGFLFLLAAGFLILGGHTALLPADYNAHLATGRALATGQPDGAPAYGLYARSLYALHSLGGDGLVMAAGTLGRAGLAALAWPVLLSLGTGLSATAAMLLFAWTVLPISAVSAPGMEMLWSLLFMFLLSRPRTWATWVSLAFVQWVWSGCGLHFLLGPVLAATAVLARKFEEPRGTAVPSRVAPLWETLASGLLALLPLLHAKGLALWNLGWRAWSTGRLPAPAGYWFSPLESWRPSLAISRLVLATLFIAASTLVLCRRKLNIFPTTTAVLGGLLMLRSYTYLPIAAVLCLPFLSLSFQVLIESLEQRLLPSAQTPSSLMIGVVGIAVAGSVASVITGATCTVSGLPAPMARDEFIPVEALNFIQQSGMPRRWFSLPMDGGAVMWARPDASVYADARPGTQDTGRMERLARAIGGDSAALESLFGGADFDGALINCCLPDSRNLLRRLQYGPEWGLAYFDGLTAVYLSRLSVPPALRQNSAWQRAGAVVLEAEVRRLDAAREQGHPAFSLNVLGGMNFFHAIQRPDCFEPLAQLLRPVLPPLRKAAAAAPPPAAEPAPSSPAATPNLPDTGTLSDGTLPLPGRPR